MGDRRMAEVKVSHGSLYIYTHWAGYQWPEEARKALAKAQPRIGDDSYALRIVVDHLTEPGRDQETGYGLLLKPDAEDSYNHNQPSIIIDLVNNTLQVIDSNAEFVWKEWLAFYGLGEYRPKEEE